MRRADQLGMMYVLEFFLWDLEFCGFACVAYRRIS